MRWKDLLQTRPGIIIGIAAGLFLGLLYLIVGFWKMFVFAMIVAFCSFIGHLMDPAGSNAAVKWLDWLENRRRRF